jgi:integrase
MFNSLIEKYIEAGLPRVASTSIGNLTSSSAKNFCYHLIGTKRTQKLKFFDDENGDGHVVRRDNNLRDWNSFWINNGSAKDNRCVYDSGLGHSYLEELKKPRVTGFLNRFKTVEMKRHYKNAISNVITWGIDNQYFGDEPPVNPAHNIKLKKNTKEITHRKNKTFTPEEYKKIWTACDEIKHQYPYQTTLIKLLMVSPFRKQEALKLKWSFIKDNIIEVPTSISKIRLEQDVDISPAIRVVIEELKELKAKYQWSKFLPWCFPSIKVRNKSLKHGKPYYSKKFPHSSRLRDVKNAWRDIKKLTGIQGTLKMFKKTHHNMAQTVVSDPYELIGITRHTNTNTLQKNYLQHDLDKRRKQSNKIGEKFLNIVK